MTHRLAAAVAGRRSRWVVIGIWVVLLAVSVPLSAKLPDVTSDSTAGFVPSDSQSAEASRLLAERFPGGDTSPILLAYRREGGLSAADRKEIGRHAALASKVPLAGPPVAPFLPRSPPGLVAEEGDVAFTLVPLRAADERKLRESIEALREIAHSGPPGLTAHATGAPAIESDEMTTREDAEGPLFLVTALLVLTLLIAVYRSPIIALVPLAVVGVAYTVATAILYLLTKAGMEVTGTSRSLLVVLMFGAGTDYCLLLVARYIEALRHERDPLDAMAIAVPRSAPAIAASGATVMAALLTLVVAKVSLISTLGPVNAIGVGVGLIASLTLLPALITVVGRRAFWPNAAKVAYQPEAAASSPGRREGVWRRLGERVLARPVAAIAGVLVLLAVGSLGLLGFQTTGDLRGSILRDTDGTRGFDLLADSFPAGALAPATVVVERSGGRLARADLDKVRAGLKSTPDLGTILPTVRRSTDGGAAALSVVFPVDPYSDAGYTRVRGMRAALERLGPPFRGVIGGATAVSLDFKDSTNADFRTVVPLGLAVIFLTLVLLLRALVAPLYLIASVVASFFGILGLSVFLLENVLDITNFNAAYPVFAFIFLVALGVDYNIFLMDRVREEVREHGTREGTVRALVATGPVITSAGLILAGTFAALLVVPLSTLKALGFTVALGVLVDTFLVRTVLMPAVVATVGDRSWWPSSLSRGKPPAPPPSLLDPRNQPTVVHDRHRETQ